MRILFLHPNFPAQFRHVATAIARDKQHQVVFGTTRRDGHLSGVYKALYKPVREARRQTHHYLHTMENAVLQGQAVYRMAEQLKARGFVPDVIYGHSGWGPTLFCKDIFPTSQLLCYFEWFYHAHGSDADFDPSEPLSVDSEARIRMKNTPILTDLYSCDRGLSPTYWQRHQFPREYQDKITVLHDGVDTQVLRPKLGAKLILPRINLDLTHVDELVTYVGRGMEPYRGFPQFIEAVALLQQRRPHCHVVIVGSDRVAYGKPLSNGKTYKESMLETFPLDLSRIHFTGHLPYDEYLQVLQASSAHVYLTRPFVLSWSMIEAMSVGCLLVASNTAPVTEVIQDGVNGLLADFFSPTDIADRLVEALTQRDAMQELRTKARQTVLARYDLATLLPQHLQWIQQGIASPLRFSMPSTPFQLITPPAMPSPPPQSPDAIATPINASNNHQKTPSHSNSLQVGNRTVTAAELPPLLSQCQLLPELWQESKIDEAIDPFTCTPDEEEQCCQQFYAQLQLTSEADQQAWLQQQGFDRNHLIKRATRSLRIEKFKRATWGNQLKSYFLKCKHKLDHVVYSLIRVQDSNTAQELFSRLREDGQCFAELARRYSQGREAQTGGLIGPVTLSTPHPQLARLILSGQPGQILPPTRLAEWWLIVRLEEIRPAQLDSPTQQRLLDELFDIWLQEQRQQTTLKPLPKPSVKRQKSQKIGFAPKAR